jgi:choline kinase/phosphatidylglycerophosphate synthase
MSETASPRARPELPLGDAGGLQRPRSAVVLAAGLSTRMAGATRHGSKALMRFGGVPLVERVVRRLLALGIEDVLVVVGAHVRPVTAFVNAIAPGRVRAILAEDWSQGNGASLAAAERYLAEEPLFLCVTTDHLFGEGSLEPLLTAGRPAVLVDHAPSPEVWAEGTRVRLHGDDAVAFSKELTHPAVDCGAFLLSPAVFEAQREAARAGDHSLAGAVSRLATRWPLAAVPLPRGAWWFDLDTPADVRAARRAHRRSLTKASDGPVARYLNRPVSTRVSMAIARFRPHPDVLSVIAFLLGLGGAALLWTGTGPAAAVAVQLASILDGVDGEVARLQNRARAQGALLDGVLDRLADAAVAAGLAGWALSDGHVPESGAIVLAVAATALSLLSMATKDRISSLGLAAAPEGGLNLLLGGRDGRLLLVALAALAGQPLWALGAIVVTCGLSLVLRLVFVLRRASQP